MQRLEKIKLSGPDGKTGGAEVLVHAFSPRERLLRAGKRGGVALCVTLVCILIPLLHFVLVPLGLITTACIAVSEYSQKKMISAGGGSCPYCGKEFKISPRAYQLPFDEVCEHCHRHFNAGSEL